MFGLPWHVLQVVSNHERRVVQHLTVRSVEYYLPLYNERVKWTDRTVMAERPLFSGYVFAHILPENRRSMIGIPGLLHILGDEERDMVSGEELEKIREGLTSGLLLSPHVGVPVGTRVRVCHGVFGGVEGVVSELRKQCKVIITLTGVRQSFSIEVALDGIEVMTPVVPKIGLQPTTPGYSYS